MTDQERIEKGRVPATREERSGNCYEIAGRFVLQNPDCKLCHGHLFNEDHSTCGPLPHAWAVLPSGRVFEPYTGQIHCSHMAEEFFGMVAYEEYDCENAIVMMLKHKHFGPWNERSEKAHKDFVRNRDALDKQHEMNQ